MLLKYSQYQKRSKLTASAKPQRTTGGSRVVAGKGGHRRGMKGGPPAKRISRAPPIGSKREEVESVCDNSNDSGLGFDHHVELSQAHTVSPTYSDQEYWTNGAEGAKKRRLDIKLETDDANGDFTFPRQPAITPSQPLLCVTGTVGRREANSVVGVGVGGKGRRPPLAGGGCAASRDGKVELRILSQPEGQHRARYQTEGSRGAVKDTSGNGFPIVKLSGYDRGAMLEVYIGTDQGRVAPHMFYQACKVSGKNSTPCVERKLNGTVLIQIDFDPTKEMVITCDCVGILKERNVDVEQRFPEEGSTRSRKKSTRCRMVFRTTITRPDGSLETLQVTSHPIVCTQPPGVPEICKKSLSSCPVSGGVELFILGKNFLKDTRVVFTEGDPASIDYWEASVTPDKDFLHQSHLVCVIPAYKSEDTKENVYVRLCVVSGDRRSEPQSFVFSPAGTPPSQVLPQDYTTSTRSVTQSLSGSTGLLGGGGSLLIGTAVVKPVVHAFITEEPKQEMVAFTTAIKGEENWEEMRQTDPSMATLRRFVTDTSTPLPALSVDTYLSKIENQEQAGIARRERIQVRPQEQLMPPPEQPPPTIQLLGPPSTATDILVSTSQPSILSPPAVLASGNQTAILTPTGQTALITQSGQTTILTTTDTSTLLATTDQATLLTTGDQTALLTSTGALIAPTSQATLLTPVNQQTLLNPGNRPALLATTDQTTLLATGNQTSLLAPASQTALMSPTTQTTLLTANNQNVLLASGQPGILSGSSQTELLSGNSQAGLLSGNSQTGLLTATSQTGLLTGDTQTALLTGNSQTALLTGNSQTALLTGNSQTALLTGNSQTALLTGSSQTALLNGSSQTALLNGNSEQGLLVPVSQAPMLSPAGGGSLLGGQEGGSPLGLLAPPLALLPAAAPQPPARDFLPAPQAERKDQEAPQPPKKVEEGIPLHEITQMSEHDLLSYINPSCFDQV